MMIICVRLIFGKCFLKVFRDMCTMANVVLFFFGQIRRVVIPRQMFCLVGICCSVSFD